MNKENYAVYKRFNRYLQESGVKPCALAKQAGVNYSILLAMKSGHVPNTRQLVAICCAAGLSADYLLGLRDDNVPVAKQIPIHKRSKIISENLEKLVKENSGKPAIESRKCGISGDRITKYIERTEIPMTAIALKIAQHYNVSLDWLLGLSEEERA